MLKHLGKGRQGKAMDDCRRQQSTKTIRSVHRASEKETTVEAAERRESLQHWTAKELELPVPISTAAVPHCPPCPMEVTSAGAKLEEQSRVLGCWLLHFPAQNLGQRRLQLVFP